MALALPVDLAVAVALLVLAAGAVGSLVPAAPGGVLSLVGVYGYWWTSGFDGSLAAFVAVATLLALVAVAVDTLGGAVAASAAGTTTRTAAVAGLVGLLLIPVAGPLGIFAGIGVVVYAAERRRGTARRESLRVAGRTLVGMVLTNGVQFVLTSLVLVGFVVVVVL